MHTALFLFDTQPTHQSQMLLKLTLTGGNVSLPNLHVPYLWDSGSESLQNVALLVRFKP